MRDLLHLVYEYRQLVAREGELSERARERLGALDRLFGTEPGAADAAGPLRQHARCDVEVAAVLTASGTEYQVTVVNLGGGGLCIERAPELEAGQSAVIRLMADGCLYEYPVEARWRAASGADALMGMPFCGAPRKLELAAGIEVANDAAEAPGARASGG